MTFDSRFAERLFHRWFVAYNPLYFASAALVLLGVNLVSHELAGRAAYAHFAVAGIAEAYAWALILAAAWLMRLGSRRPAVLLALIVAVYQCDPTLYTETCANLGSAGLFGGAAWLFNFLAKLYGLLWALRLRMSHACLAVATLGAAGLTILPRALPQLDETKRGLLIASWVFALFAAGLWSKRQVVSRVALDAWSETVLRRSARATWSIWAVLALCHVGLWMDDLGVSISALVPAAVLLSTRFMHREAAVWFTASVTLVIVAATMPQSFYATSTFAAVALALRALRQPTAGSFQCAARPAVLRLLTGSLSCTYLAAWTLFWTAGPWPEHVLLLDTLFASVFAALFWKLRARLAALPLTAGAAHLAGQMGLVLLPSSVLEWGVTAVISGFALLAGAVAATWHYRNVDPASLSANWEHDLDEPAPRSASADVG